MFKKVLSLVFGNGFSQIINMIFIMILVRTFSKVDYATYQQSYLIANSIQPFLVLGFPITLSYFISKSENKKNITINTFIISNILGILGMVIVYLSAAFIATQYANPGLNTSIKVISFFIFFEVSTSYGPNLLIATEREKTLLKLTMGLSIIKIALLLLSIIFNESILSIIWGITFISALKYIFYFINISFYFRLERYGFNKKLLISQIKYALPIGLSTIISTISIYIDKNMIAYLFSPEQYVIYSSGATEIPLISIITGSVTSIILPRISKVYSEKAGDKDKSRKIWFESIIGCAVILIPIMFALLMYSEGFIEILFSKEYLESTQIFKIYLFNLPLRIVTFGTMLTIMGLGRKLLFNSIISLVVNILLNVIMLNIFGIVGPAYATIISTYFLAIMQLNQIKKGLGVTFYEVFPWRKLIKIFCICIITFIIFSLLNKYIEFYSNILNFIIFGGVYVLLNIAIFYRFNIFDIKMKAKAKE